MRILNVICSTDPKQGGVIEWVRQFAPIAISLGHTVEVASMDNPNDPWVRDFPVPVHAFGQKFKNFYSANLVSWLKSNADNYDVCIAHGLWRYPSTATHMALHKSSTPYFVYTHGMLDPWFKTYYPLKHIGKWLYWYLTEYRVLRDASGVIFTCEQEKNKARESFWPYKVHELVSTIGIQSPSGDKISQASKFYGQFPETKNKRLLLFLGRIHPKKGCDYLVQAFARSASTTPDLHLVFAGPGDKNWIAQLKQLAQENGISDRITWTGMIEGDIKWGAFHTAEAFLLPSHQENFGISVVEALACSLPVLISNKVDIYSEIETDQAGIIAEDTLEATTSILAQWLDLTPNAKQKMRDRALKCYENRFEVHSATRQLLELLDTNIA